MHNQQSDILTRIIEHKKTEIRRAMQQINLQNIQSQITNLSNTVNFTQAIINKLQQKIPAVIAEIKKASPSKGVIRENFDPITIAKSYAENGAACLSILTDEKFFQGHNDYLVNVRKISSLPILRKDFIIDPYQIYQSRLLGADCILLIAAVLDDKQLQTFTDIAIELNLDILIEVHGLAELQRVLPLNTPLIGINNRNLRTFVTDLQATLDLIPHIPANKIVITESGIRQRADVALMQKNGVHAFLVGESFMREDDPGTKLKELFF